MCQKFEDREQIAENRKWEVEVDGEKVTQVTKLAVENT